TGAEIVRRRRLATTGRHIRHSRPSAENPTESNDFAVRTALPSPHLVKQEARSGLRNAASSCQDSAEFRPTLECLHIVSQTSGRRLMASPEVHTMLHRSGAVAQLVRVP